MKFVNKPNLPQGRVGTVMISCSATDAINKLKSFGINTIIINPDYRLPEPVSDHADLQILHLKNNIILTHNEHLCAGESTGKIFLKEISEFPGSHYPNDVRLNCAIIGNKIICNKKTISKEILEYAEKESMTVINVNQGYSKCSICIVNENAIITDDKSIFKAAGNFFDDVQFVSKGSIRLNGYNYGFIGGCCGKIDKNKIAFNGEIESHEDHNKIIDFINRNRVECIELKKGQLIDIGGILPLEEYT